MTINGKSPVALSDELRLDGSALVCSMTNRDLDRLGEPGRIPRDTFLIRRVLSFSDDVLFETVEIKNFGPTEEELQIEVWAGGRFDDVFEVRGFSRVQRGRLLPPIEMIDGDRRITTLQYDGLDHLVRSTSVQRLFAVEKIRVSPHLIGHFARVKIAAKQTIALKTIVSFNEISDGRVRGTPFQEISIPGIMHLLKDRGERSSLGGLRFECDNALLTRAIHNAQTDISMLLTSEKSGELYPYAGIPWYSAPFGRDGLITGYQLLPWYPKVARGVLNYCLNALGSKVDPFTEEQPGKVFHELRRGEMANIREVPFIPYYGSVDSTPLCLILLHEYIRWTSDLKSLKEWWPLALDALEWVRRWGDPDGDGFLEYAKLSPTGLVNQGWKDSHNSIMHIDGRLASAPIRLCEVQAYAYRARLGMSQLAGLMGDSSLALALRSEALELKSLFMEKFWNPHGKFVYLALDGAGEPCSVRSSNMGHCLWSQLLSPERAAEVADHLMSKSMFSGYGIRTLADDETAYNPMSYHNGSVWPHDNSLIMEGFRYYGFTEGLNRQILAMMGLLETSEDFRLPELFCGFRRRADTPPVPYEVACKPQAWAAGALFLMIKAMMGLSKEIDPGYVVLRTPVLPPSVNVVEVYGLQGGDWELDLRLRKTQGSSTVEVLRRSGGVRVLTVR